MDLQGAMRARQSKWICCVIFAVAACTDADSADPEAGQNDHGRADSGVRAGARDARPDAAAAPADEADAAVRDELERPPPVHDCGLDTGFPGDDACIVAPEDGQGFQLHYGPSDYDDAAQMDAFVLEPDQEFVDCFYLNTPNEAAMYYDYFVNAFRPQTHHMIVSQLSGDVPDGLSDCSAAFMQEVQNAGMVGGSTVASRSIGSDRIAPENEGLAAVIEPNTQIEMQLHFFNFSDQPILREAWMNVYAKDPSRVTTITAPLAGYAGVRSTVEPGQTGFWQSQMVAPADMRIVNLYSHYHANTRRMTAYLMRKDGLFPEVIYESYNWEDPGVLPLDSVHDNPGPDPERRQMGGLTGILELQAGDILLWQCEIKNEHSFPIRWGNQAYDADMCILRGNYAPSTGSSWVAFGP